MKAHGPALPCIPLHCLVSPSVASHCITLSAVTHLSACTFYCTTAQPPVRKNIRQTPSLLCLSWPADNGHRPHRTYRPGSGPPFHPCCATMSSKRQLRAGTRSRPTCRWAWQTACRQPFCQGTPQPPTSAGMALCWWPPHMSLPTCPTWWCLPLRCASPALRTRSVEKWCVTHPVAAAYGKDP